MAPVRRVGAATSVCSPAGGPLMDLMITHRHSLISIARSFVGCSSRAEDVVHDVCIKLTELSGAEAIRQPLAYITRMVRNASIDNCRRQKLENLHYAAEDDGLDVPSAEPTPEAALMTRDALRRACAALAELPVRTRAAFEMVCLREKTLRETASALNVSQTLVHFMVRDATRHCAGCLRGEVAPCAQYEEKTRGKKTPGAKRHHHDSGVPVADVC
ncbi:MAG: RNA polymerase factor sigma-70 [Janthinobacterium lividum]